MNTQQQTIAKEAVMQGTGLHTGKDVTIRLKPAEANHGIIFRRVDGQEAVDVPALASNVVDTSRGTTLEAQGVRVYTVEHLLAALTGMQIDNCLIELDNEEIPIMDGSAMPFVNVLKECGVSEQGVQRNFYEIKEVVRFTDPSTNSEILVVPSEQTRYTVMVDYGTKVLGTQNAYLDSWEEFSDEIASSRTFSFLHELKPLLNKGLIKGGDLKNAIIYVDKEIDEETMLHLKDAFGQQSVEITPNGVLNNLELKHPNEAARHKLLDVVGDLALLGRPIKGHVIATRPGHKVNTDFAKYLAQEIKKESRSSVPVYDQNAEPLLDVVQIMERLPHRPPFLLVDKVIEMSENHVVGVKNVTMNESFFNGHFPGAPVMPGVLQVEAMAQVGGILALSTVPDPENYLTYFLRLDSVKFKNKVVPGDTIVFKLELTAPIRRGLVQMTGEAYVGNKVVMQAEMMAQIKKEKNI